MSYSVIQIGARRNYAVPALLEQAGLLERFYTDVCADVGIGKFLTLGRQVPLIGPRLRRLANRRLPPGVDAKTITFARPLIRHALRTCAAQTSTQKYRAHIRWGNELGDAISEAGFGPSTRLYSMLGECPTALAAARARGMKVISEIYILLSADAIVAEERSRFPDWESVDLEYETYRKALCPERTLLANSDFAICPSELVRQDLISTFGFSADKTAVVPYGVEEEWLQVQNRPVAGRVLFAGSACLRKGIQYLAAAASIMKDQGYAYQFVVAGDVQPKIRNHPLCSNLEFLGRIPRTAMAREFSAADVFALPSLAEGSAEVVYQALAVGLPVVTTLAAGSVVRDGLEGFIVPERDSTALVDAIVRIVKDRAARERFSEAARRRAAEYTWQKYRERLQCLLRAL